MAIINTIISGVKNYILGGSAQGGLMEQVLGLINNPKTGVPGGLIQIFDSKSFDDAMSSRVGTGENQPVSGEQLTNVFGNRGIQEIAQKLGISGAAIQSGLVASLLRFIDKHIPDRTAPEGDLLTQGLNVLKQKLPG